MLLLLTALPLAAGTLPGTRSWRVTLAAYAAPDAAAAARRLAAMYRGELETPVDAQGAFLIALTDAAAALLESDPAVQSVQPEGSEAVPSSPSPTTVRTPQIIANASASWSLGTYVYDGVGNIEKIGTDPYVYDLQNRVVSGVAGGKTEQYTYDEFGNILTIETTGSAKQYLGVDPATNRMSQTTGIVGGQTVTYDKTAGYDAAGNVTSHQLDQFQYDGLNVLTKAYVASKWRSYVYNASDERIGVIERSSATGAETRSDWTLRDASGQVLRRLSREGGQWQWNEDYIYRGSQMLAAEVAGPAKRYQYHLDHLGTPRLITGNGGVEISRHTYLPFGTEVGAIAGQNPADGEWKKFTGHERDQGSIDYMHARYYNPFMGRFLAVDPANSATATMPQTWNRYSYTSNNPLARVDPDGRDWYAVIMQEMGGRGRAAHEAIVWIDTRGFGTTYEHPLGHSEYVGPYSGSFANRQPAPHWRLTATRFRNLGPTFDPSAARANGTGPGWMYNTGRLQCTNYCAFMIGDPVAYSLGGLIFGTPPRPDLVDRMNDPRYVLGILVDGRYWPADMAGVVGGGYIEVTGQSGSRVSYPDSHLFARPIAPDGGTTAVYYNGAPVVIP